MARTLAQAEEEYTAVRTAYLKALEAESYSVSSGAGSRSLARPRSESLRKQLDQLAEEVRRLGGTYPGITVTGGTPVG